MYTFCYAMMMHIYVKIRAPKLGGNAYFIQIQTTCRCRIRWERSFKPPSILILTVPRRYFCCGSLLLLVLAVRIYTLVQLLC